MQDAIPNMTKTRWKDGDYSVTSDMAILTLQDELKDLYLIIQNKDKNKLINEDDRFFLKLKMDSLVKFLSTLKNTEVHKREVFSDSGKETIITLKEVYKILDIKY